MVPRRMEVQHPQHLDSPLASSNADRILRFYASLCQVAPVPGASGGQGQRDCRAARQT